MIISLKVYKENFILVSPIFLKKHTKCVNSLIEELKKGIVMLIKKKNAFIISNVIVVIH